MIRSFSLVAVTLFLGAAYGINSTPLADLPPETSLAAFVSEEDWRTNDRLCYPAQGIVLSQAALKVTCQNIHKALRDQTVNSKCTLVLADGPFVLSKRWEISEDISFELPLNPTLDDFLLALKAQLRSRVKICKMDHNSGSQVINNKNNALPWNHQAEDLSEDRFQCSLSLNKNGFLTPVRSNHLSKINIELYTPDHTIRPIQNVRLDCPALKDFSFVCGLWDTLAFLPFFSMDQNLKHFSVYTPLLSDAGDIGFGVELLKKFRAQGSHLRMKEFTGNRFNTYNIYSQKTHPKDRSPYQFTLPSCNALEKNNQLPSPVTQLSLKVTDHEPEHCQSEKATRFKVRHRLVKKSNGSEDSFIIMEEVSVQPINDTLAEVHFTWTTPTNNTLIGAGPLYVTPARGKTKIKLRTNSKKGRDGLEQTFFIGRQLLLSHLQDAILKTPNLEHTLFQNWMTSGLTPSTTTDNAWRFWPLDDRNDNDDSEDKEDRFGEGSIPLKGTATLMSDLPKGEVELLERAAYSQKFMRKSVSEICSGYGDIFHNSKKGKAEELLLDARSTLDQTFFGFFQTSRCGLGKWPCKQFTGYVAHPLPPLSSQYLTHLCISDERLPKGTLFPQTNWLGDLPNLEKVSLSDTNLLYLSNLKECLNLGTISISKPLLAYAGHWGQGYEEFNTDGHLKITYSLWGRIKNEYAIFSTNNNPWGPEAADPFEVRFFTLPELGEHSQYNLEKMPHELVSKIANYLDQKGFENLETILEKNLYRQEVKGGSPGVSFGKIVYKNATYRLPHEIRIDTVTPELARLSLQWFLPNKTVCAGPLYVKPLQNNVLELSSDTEGYLQARTILHRLTLTRVYEQMKANPMFANTFFANLTPIEPTETLPEGYDPNVPFIQESFD